MHIYNLVYEPFRITIAMEGVPKVLIVVLIMLIQASAGVLDMQLNSLCFKLHIQLFVLVL